MATHSLKGTFDKSGPQNQWWRHCDVICQSISTKFCIFVCYTERHLCANLSKIEPETKKLQKMGNDIIVTSFLKIAHQFLVCEYFYSFLPIDVPSFKLIEGQIKELLGVVPNTLPPGWEWQKSPGRIGLRLLLDKRMWGYGNTRVFTKSQTSV